MPWSVSAAAIAQLPASCVPRAGVGTVSAFEDLMKGKLWSAGSLGRLPSSGAGSLTAAALWVLP